MPHDAFDVDAGPGGVLSVGDVGDPFDFLDDGGGGGDLVGEVFEAVVADVGVEEEEDVLDSLEVEVEVEGEQLLLD